MLKKRVIISLTFKDGVLFRTKKFIPDYRYTKNFVDMWNCDEIILNDISDKNKQSEIFLSIVKDFISLSFVPISVGGGLDTFNKIINLFSLGVDRVILNSAVHDNYELLKKVADKYGSQSATVSIDCKKINNKYEHMLYNGKKINNESPEASCRLAEKFGAGEIFFNNIDLDGSLMGFEIEIIQKLSTVTNLPFIACGGGGKWEHFLQVFKNTNISGVCTQNIYHFTDKSIEQLKNHLNTNSINIRN
ncbi:HisA/HisF-related TIM barrel protein [Candidatus Pelagibacter sp.]|nr:HisA/HisF-related TIM barrel protein [Candidatus Pelagibacter sp.]